MQNALQASPEGDQVEVEAFAAPVWDWPWPSGSWGCIAAALATERHDVGEAEEKRAALEALRAQAYQVLSGAEQIRLVVARAEERYRMRAAREAIAGEQALRLSYKAPSMAPVDKAIGRVVRTDATVLLLVESGTGKEVAARAIHLESSRALLARIGHEVGRPDLRISVQAMQLITRRAWPGNVRELANALERASILTEDGELREEHFGSALEGPEGGTRMSLPTMEEAEREAIRKALAHFDGNRRQVAKHIGIGLRTLYDKRKRYGLT